MQTQKCYSEERRITKQIHRENKEFVGYVIGWIAFSSMTRVAMYEGCTVKPTPRSETARLKSSVFKGLGSDESFVKG